MSTSVASGGRVAARSSRGSVMIEGLESRQFLSASPVVEPAVAPTPPLVRLSAVTPAKITAGNAAKPGVDYVFVRNPTTAPVTEEVSITLVPSLDGMTAAGSFGTSPTFDETVTIRQRGIDRIKVTFVPPITLTGGKYHTLATVVLGTQAPISAEAPGVYTLIIPPVPTTTPSLVGHYQGLVSGSSEVGSGGIVTHEFGFIWNVTSQTLTGLTGTFTIGDGSTTGTMTGTELSNGAIAFTLVSSNINYTVTGTITNNGATIKGICRGTLVDNLFKRVNGHFTLNLQPPS